MQTPHTPTHEERLDRLPPDLDTKPFRFYFRRHKRSFAAGVVALLLTNVLDMLTPLALMRAVDMLKIKNLDGLGYAIGAYTGLMIGVTIFRHQWRIHFGRFHHSVADDLRNRIFAKLTVLGPGFYQRNPVGRLMSLITNDVNQFRMAIGSGTLFILDAVFIMAVVVPTMFWLSPSWTWKTLLFLPLVPWLMRRMERLTHERSRVRQDRLSDVSASSQEIVSGIRVIKSYHQESNQRAAFNRVSRDYEHACNRVAAVDASFEPAMEFAIAAGGVSLLWLCSDDVARGAMSLGAFVAFHEYIRKMVWPMTAIGLGVSMIEQGRAAMDRVREMLRTETDIPDLGDVEIDDFHSLEIKSLSFRYPGAESGPHQLKDLSLRIEAGETVGLVGPVGAGKTTLLHLIARLYPSESGRILVNGHPIERIRARCLRSVISLVPQEAFLFSDTISENIALGLELHPGLERVRDAAGVVNIDKEVESLPQGYDSYLGERGVNLSGGQKQRLTIARALIRRTPLVMLDDSLSAVDGGTERAIVRSLREALVSREERRQTTIIVSHRLATLRHADRIVVLDNGRIEAVGTHEELLALSPTYRNLHQLQTEHAQGDAEKNGAQDFLRGQEPAVPVTGLAEAK